MLMKKRIILLSVVGLLVLCAGAVAQTEANKAIERRVFEEIWNEGVLDVADEVFAPNAVLHGLVADDLAGPEAFKQTVAAYRAAIPDIHWAVEDQIAEGDMVVTRLTGTGTHQGELMGIPATGLQIAVTAIATVRIAEGKIQESWNSWDAAGLMQQLGAMPPTRETYTWGELSEVTGDAGAPETNKAGVQRMIDEVMNQGNLAVIDELFAADYLMHDPAWPVEVKGSEGFKQWAGAMLEPFFSDSQITGEVIAEGDKVAVYWIWSGIHTGEFMGIPGTGRQIVVAGTSIHRFADGQFVESWASYDGLGMMQQLTAVGPVDPGSEGVVAYYALDGDATDDAGNGLDGTVMGDPEWIDGIIGGALELDGDGDYIDCGSDPSLDITGPISLSLWIRPDADDPEGSGTETAPMAKAMNGMSPPWSWQVRYGWGSPQPTMTFTFNTSPRAWAYVGQNLEQGEWHHIACSADGETLTAYLNGQATESTPMGAITSSPAPILIGSDGWGSDWIGGIDEVKIFNRALSAGEVQFLTGYMADVTAPGDLVQGVPNDGDWPGGEIPDLALDDDVNTKYLHFKGDFDPDAGPTGFCVKPGVGPTVVTGITFITANDVAGRDPIAFELYGSNVSIDGPYTLIAGRDIVDFAQTDEWPRFTKNQTPIAFSNDTAYAYYQVLITAIRGPVGGSVDSMQIAEVELFGMPLLPTSDIEANKQVARRFFEEMWNDRNLDIVEELISADMRGHAPTGEFTGYEGERQTILGTVAAFPDLVITIDEIIAEDNKVALMTSYHGTHTGTLMGQIPPTGAEITMTGGILFHFADGKIVEAWSFADMLGLMQQIGAASPPRPTPEDYAWSAPSEVTGDPGDPETNKAMVARFVDEVWNQRNLDPIAELFHPEIIGNNPPVAYMYAPPNRETFTQSIADYLAAYPDMDVTLNDIVAEGDKAMAYWTTNATHGGELMGIPPTDSRVTFSGHTMYRFVDGQVVQTWWAWDTMGMVQQITATEATE